MRRLSLQVHVALGTSCLRSGQRILLHAAAGGVGIIAVQYALHLHTTVTATAGQPAKHAILRSLCIRNSASSRAAPAFAYACKRDGGARRHHVLNSLSKDFTAVSLALLGEGGSFAEIGKRDVWSRSRAAAARVSSPSASFTPKSASFAPSASGALGAPASSVALHVLAIDVSAVGFTLALLARIPLKTTHTAISCLMYNGLVFDIPLGTD